MFTSQREKWLWFAAGAIIAVIFAGLFFGRPFIDLLRSEYLQAAIFIAGMVLTVIAILLHAFIHNPSRANLVILLGIAIAYGMFFLRLGLPERSHLLEYSLLAICVHEILVERARHGRALRPALIWAFIISFGIGCLDEGLQLILPERVFDWYDIAFNGFVVFIALAARGAIDGITRWRRR